MAPKKSTATQKKKRNDPVSKRPIPPKKAVSVNKRASRTSQQPSTLTQRIQSVASYAMKDDEGRKKLFPILEHLPYVVMREFVRKLNIVDLVELSLVSKRCTAKIKGAICRKFLPKTTMGIRFGKDDRAGITFTNDEEKVYFHWSFEKSKGSSKHHHVVGNDVIPIRKKTKFNEEDEYKQKTEWTSFCRSKPHIAMNWAILHLMQILPCSDKYIKIENEVGEMNFDIIGALAGVSRVREVCCNLQSISQMKTLRYILENIKITRSMKCLSLLHMSYPGTTLLSFCKGLISFQNCNWMDEETFLSLKSNNIRLTQTRLTTQAIETFIDMWFNMDESKMNLHYVSIGHPTDSQKINYKRWGGQKRGEISEERPKYHKFDWDFTDCYNGIDIQRSDGLLATLKLSDNNTHFLVWHESSFNSGLSYT